MSRPYHQFCGVAKALDVVGERWTLLVVRELLLGPRRFGEISEALAGVPPALLTQRLKDLEGAGLVAKEGRRAPYALTEAGRDLEPVVLALGRFGARYLTQPDADDRMNMRWAMLSLKRRYGGDHGRWTLELRPGEGVFTVELGGSGSGITRSGGSGNGITRSGGSGIGITRSGGSGNAITRSPAPIDVHDGPAPSPDAALSGPPMAVGALLMGRRTLDQLLTEGAIRIDGDRAAVDALLSGLGLAG